MKRLMLLLLAAALMASVAIPASASARPHHHKLRGCKKGFHHPRKPGGGRYRRCVKNRPHPKPAAPIPGAPGAPGAPGTKVEVITPQPPPPPPSSKTVYDNIESITKNPASLSFFETGTSEFGSQEVLEGNNPATKDPQIQIGLSSWACQSGVWNSGCTTTPGSTFIAPITLNIYEVGPENAVGVKLFTKTTTWAVHYRPSSDVSCPESTQFRNAQGQCSNGLPQIVTYTFTAITLPRRFILSVVYATPENDPRDFLKVGLEGPPAKGSNPTEAVGGVYFNRGSIFHYNGPEGTVTQHLLEWPVGESQIAAHIVASH